MKIFFSLALLLAPSQARTECTDLSQTEPCSTEKQALKTNQYTREAAEFVGLSKFGNMCEFEAFGSRIAAYCTPPTGEIRMMFYEAREFLNTGLRQVPFVGENYFVFKDKSEDTTKGRGWTEIDDALIVFDDTRLVNPKSDGYWSLAYTQEDGRNVFEFLNLKDNIILQTFPIGENTFKVNGAYFSDYLEVIYGDEPDNKVDNALVMFFKAGDH
jgi:hypothetical protein